MQLKNLFLVTQHTDYRGNATIWSPICVVTSGIAIKAFKVVIQLFGHSPHCNSILNYTNNSQQCASL